MNPDRLGLPARPSLLVVGGGSFIASAVLRLAPSDWRIVACSHRDWARQDPGQYDVVLGCAFDRSLFKEPYDEAKDVDAAIAAACRPHTCRYVMLSSRMVYGSGQPLPITEAAPLRPDTPYGYSKMRSEEKVRDALGDRCAILRLGNVFGFEPGRHTFFGRALHTLGAEGHITLDVSPFVERDFISDEECAELLWKVIRAGQGGTYNLSRGEGVAIGRIALWLMEGFGSGILHVVGTSERDPFILDNTALRRLISASHSRFNVREQCIDIGRRLSKWNRC